MEIGMREWLIVIGGLLLLAVLIDGFRRMSSARRNTLRMSKGMLGGGFDKAIDDFGSELPSGGARVVGVRDPNTGDLKPVTKQADVNLVGINSVDINSVDISSRGINSFDSGDPLFDEELPVLNENLSLDFLDDKEFNPALGDLAPFTALDEKSGFQNNSHQQQAKPKQSEPKHLDPKHLETKHLETKQPEPKQAESKVKRSIFKPLESATKKSTLLKGGSARGKTETAKEKPQRGLDEVIVISVVAKHPKGFEGKKLFKILEACGLYLGEMSIYHRHEYDVTEGPIQFSVANLVKPGNFAGIDQETFMTPGLTFFLGLPGPDEPMKAFEYMLETAKCIAQNLGGELKDELRSAMTTQTIEHSRQRVRDFERLQLSIRNTN